MREYGDTSKAVNPTKKVATDARTPSELLDLIEAQGVEVMGAVAALRGLRAG